MGEAKTEMPYEDLILTQKLIQDLKDFREKYGPYPIAINVDTYKNATDEIVKTGQVPPVILHRTEKGTLRIRSGLNRVTAAATVSILRELDFIIEGTKEEFERYNKAIEFLMHVSQLYFECAGCERMVAPDEERYQDPVSESWYCMKCLNEGI